ncbi:hypothetical protein RZS28_16175 [Methylocapsa polymorpha]|uniref:Uncharacterized protein n=1 Tax=Methylocapsa polymorpha TaxID=3080828 RepID=A0ABZ0HRD0_9HYPH|nr:hypothetical protein RZS28_16175 [Methylocapsa sp. RX1]
MKDGKLATIFAGLLLALLAPAAASAQTAFATSNYRPGGQTLLHGPGPIELGESILQMPVPDGIYVINAKTSIINAAIDAQSGNCKLWVLIGGLGPNGTVLSTSKLVVIDQTEFRIGRKDGGSQQAVALQAAFKIVGSSSASSKNNNVIGVACRAYNGIAVDSVLTAVQILGGVVTLQPAEYEAPPPPQRF